MRCLRRAAPTHNQPKQKAGWQAKLSLEDQLLMTLEYWKQYCTYFHIGQSWGVNESTAYRIIQKMEDPLTKSRAFTLPGEKKLATSNYQLEVLMVNFIESSIERLKKTKKVLQ
ncbi:transposase family protein [Nostoc sp. CHAB 5824]|nr:transposase family protein [Nostoc sp. CHAB 5824]